jgi:phosphatidylserine/phosphatidylglycerophosphate/cardiolipin synthase-like enzyme
MASVIGGDTTFSVRAYQGDAKTLLAFNLDPSRTKDLAGFTVQVKPEGVHAYYLYNTLQFENPSDHFQVQGEPAYSTVNAPLHKFRWLHVPGTSHQGLKPAFGPYTYTVTPRYFANGSLQQLDPARSVLVAIDVSPFRKGSLRLGMTRGFVQSQGYVNKFGRKAVIQPGGGGLLFDTSQQAGVRPHTTTPFTYADEYEWLGFTARERIFEILDEVLGDGSLHLDVFAYDLNEPDVCRKFLALAQQGRIRIVLDNSDEHHEASPSANPPEEDAFEALFRQQMTAPADILRGKFARFSHDKVFIVSNAGGPVKALTGSTNFAVTGLYVNSNHVLVFDDPSVARLYQDVFDAAWADHVQAPLFRPSALAANPHPFSSPDLPDMTINVSPHVKARSQALMDAIAARISAEGQKDAGGGSVLFAVMDIDSGTSPVYDTLRSVHTHDDIFTYGISDNPGGVYLYRPGSKRGVLATGKPGKATLPKPFSQVPSVTGHQVHHKLVVCGFNSDEPVAYCGSSNLAVQGETDNGDNLLEIRDADVVTAFAIEVVALVDHFDFLDRNAAKKGSAAPDQPNPDKTQAAKDAHWFLRTDDKWAAPYYDSNDLHFVDRLLFAVGGVAVPTP